MKKLFKNLICTAICSVTVLAISIITKAEDSIKIIVNDEQIQFDSEPFIQNERTMVPYCAIAEALGFKIEWIDENKRAVAYIEIPYDYPHIICSMQIDNPTVTLGDGSKIELYSPPLIKNDRTFLPLRALSEIMGATVLWEDATRTVTVDAFKEFSLLEDRLNIKLPVNTIDFSDELSGLNSSQTDGAYIFTIDSTIVDIYSEEILQRSTGNLTEDAKNLGYELTNIETQKYGNIEILRRTSSNSDYNRTYDNYLIKTPDNYLVTLGFIIDSENEEDTHKALDIIKKSVASITPGNRLIDLSAKTVEFDGLKITLPEGYIAFKKIYSGPFWYIMKPTESDKPSPELIINIYKSSRTHEINKSIKIDGSFLGEPITWYGHTLKWLGSSTIWHEITPTHGLYTTHILNAPDGTSAYLTFCINATTPKDRDKLVEVCSNIEGDINSFYEKYPQLFR